MKKIAITQRLTENQDYYEIRDSLDVKWAKLFKELNFLPVILPTGYNFEEYFLQLKIEGIILSGGNDLSCLSFNKLSEKRDLFEKKLIKFAIKQEIPVFGVCRGMQIIADYFGSSFDKVDNHTKTRHALKISDNSVYKNELLNLKTVNSFHNYAIKNISNELKISARNKEDIIEAIEHKKYKIFGQMWHPERETPFVNEELKLIEKIFK